MLRAFAHSFLRAVALTKKKRKFGVKFNNEDAILNAAKSYLASHHSVEASNAALKKEFEGTSHSALYGSLAEGYRLCLAMKDPANATAVAVFLRRRDLSAAKGKINPFYPLVRSLYGKEDDPALINSKWEPNPSATKYANVFRLAHTIGIKPEGFKKWLTDFNDAEFGGGVTGAERRDRKDNGYNEPDKEDALQQAIKLVTEQPPLGTIDVSGGGIADKKAKYICFWGKLGKNGTFVALGELPNMSNRVDAHLRKIAPDEAKIIREAAKLIAAREARKFSVAPQTPARDQEQSEAVAA